MSLRLDLSLVRFSTIEDIYYFYDPQYPTAIQFLLNGRWESWDVGWVRHHAHDPDIKRIAADAEIHVVNYSSTYQQWPSTPMPRLSHASLPLSPSIQSDASVPRGPMEQPFSPQDYNFPYSPISSSGPNHTAFSPPAVDSQASLPSQPHLAFLARSDSSATEHQHHATERTPCSFGEDARLELAPINSPQMRHNLAVPAPILSSAPLPGTGMAEFTRDVPPLVSPPTSLSNTPTAMSHSPTVPLPPSTNKSIPTPNSLLAATSLHATHRADANTYHSQVTAEPHSCIDPQLATTLTQPNTSPRAAHFPTASPPQDDAEERDEAPIPAPAVQLPKPQPLLVRKNRGFKIILSLDGDGIRGLSQIFIVEALVVAICTRVNQNIYPHEIFDLIGGSSLGAVFALMLSRLRMQAHTAREAYKSIAKEIFADKSAFFSTLDPHQGSVPYDEQAVENAIKKVVAAELPHVDEHLYDPCEDSVDAFAITTQIKTGSNKPAVLRTYQTRRIAGPEVDDDLRVWEAMKAAVIAPRYTQAQSDAAWSSVVQPGLMDYGSPKDNPVSDAYYECRKLFKYTNDKMFIVSIGTGFGLDPDRESREMARSVSKRTSDAGIRCVEFEREHKRLMENGWLKYYRYNVPGLDEIPLEEWCHEDQIRKKTAAYLAGPDAGQSFYKCVDDITAILTGRQPQL